MKLLRRANMRNMNARSLYGAVLFSVLCAIGISAPPAFCQDTDNTEKILFYGSTIDVATNGQLSVTETIRVRAMGQDIKRGIFRSLPTKYRGTFMEAVTIPMEVTRVLRDGSDEPYFIEEADNGSIIYIGDKDRELQPGEYTYTISYTMDRQVGFFDDHDEIYWNVTGSGWMFTIDSVHAVVNLPPGGTIINQDISAYSGASGETGCSCEIVPVSETSATFATTQPLGSYEGLTVAVPFQKGLIDAPSTDVVIDRLIADNHPAIVALIGLCLVLAYYFVAWLLVGRDPLGRSIMLRFEPPADLAPYELRYISKMKFDKKSMVVCLVSMAQNGHLTIHEHKKGEYTLTRTNDSGNTPTPVEANILQHLFGQGSSVTLSSTYNPSFVRAMDELKAHLKKNFKNSAFKLNRPWITLGIVASVLVTIYSIIQHAGEGMLIGLFMLVWLSGWTFACFMLVKGFVNGIRDKKYAQSIVLLVFMIPFLAGEVFGLVLLAGALNFYAIASTVLLIGVNIVFFGLMKAPTIHGRQMLDEIEGFSRFLITAENPRIQSLSTTPTMDIDLFQRYLPYALALDVQTEWAHHFESQMSETQRRESISWYSGRTFPHSLGEFSSSLSSSMSSTVSSSSTRPGSSSGSGGGGSSGGGGGGGGGGGW